MRIIFCGRKCWASYALEHMLLMGWEVQGVIPAPEAVWMPEPHLITIADRHNLPILNPHSPLPQGADLVISYLYPRLLRVPLLSHARIGAINFHPGLLPEFAGLRGYNFAVLEGHRVYGCTAHFMNDTFDSGDIIKCASFPISETETAFSLERKTQLEMLALFREVCNMLQRGDALPRTPQMSPPKAVTRAEFENAKKTPGKYPLERWVRAWWYPPYSGATIAINGERFTLVSDEILKSIAPRLHSEPI